VFDAIPMTHKTIFTETLREEEFAPVKNREGEDSVDSSKQLQSAFFKGWFVRAGYDVRDAGRVEVAPSFALTEKEFAQKIKQFVMAVSKDIFLG
jgi:UDP-N-acetylglucosamine pyrophosphorylase